MGLVDPIPKFKLTDSFREVELYYEEVTHSRGHRKSNYPELSFL